MSPHGILGLDSLCMGSRRQLAQCAAPLRRLSLARLADSYCAIPPVLPSLSQ